MPGYNNPRIVDLENEVLRSRLADCKAGAQALISVVERYAAPRPGDPFCSRAELLNTIEQLKSKLK